MSFPGASPGGGQSGNSGTYAGGMSACGYPQTKVSQEPRYDNRKRKRKKKKRDEQ